MKQLKYLMLPLLMLPTLCACSDDEARHQGRYQGSNRRL